MTTSLIAALTFGLLQAAPVQPSPAQPPRAQAPATAPTPTTAAPATATPATATPATTTPAAPAPTDPFTAPATPAPVEPTPAPVAQPAGGILYMPDAAPVTATPDPAAAAVTDDVKYRRLVFSNFYTLNFGIYPIPSGDLSLFLGTNLRPRRSSNGRDWNTALGYQLTMSLGYADVNYGDTQVVTDEADPDGFGNRDAIFFHRHALMAQGYGGRKGRLYYAMGGGAVMWRTLLIGIEAEGKLGYIFSARESTRLKGIIGGQMRLGGPFDGVPTPQLGLFLGFMVF